MTFSKMKIWTLFKNPFFIIVFFSIAVRILVYTLFSNIANYPDSYGYKELAGLIADFNLSGYNGQRSPGYPLLLAISGINLYVLVTVQTIIGLFTALYCYKTLVVLEFRQKTSIIVAILANCLFEVIFYEISILTESITLFFITLIFYKLANGFFTQYQSLLKLLGFSLIIGYLVLIKPFYIFIPFLIYGLYTLKYFSFKNLINRTVIILLFPLISFLGWSYINKINTGYFVSTTFFGINIAQNCVNFAEKAPDEYNVIRGIYVKHREKMKKEVGNVSMAIWSAHDELTEATQLNFADLSAKLSEFSKATISKNPGDYTKQVCISWYDYWRTSLDIGYLDFKNKNHQKFLSAMWMPQRIILRSFKILFVLFAPVHIFIFFRNRTVSYQLIITTIILCGSILQAMATYGTNSRFSFPFEFAIVISILLSIKSLIARYNLNFKI